MKTKELIRQLQECDPTGEVEVICDGGDIYTVIPLPAYYDGSLKTLIRDDSLKPYYDVIGMRETREGRKVVLQGMDLQDVCWDIDDPSKLIIEGSDEFKESAKKHIKECQDCVLKINMDHFRNYILKRASKNTTFNATKATAFRLASLSEYVSIEDDINKFFLCNKDKLINDDILKASNGLSNNDCQELYWNNHVIIEYIDESLSLEFI